PGALLGAGELDDRTFELLGTGIAFRARLIDAAAAKEPAQAQRAECGDDDDDEGNRIQPNAPTERSANLPRWLRVHKTRWIALALSPGTCRKSGGHLSIEAGALTPAD